MRIETFVKLLQHSHQPVIEWENPSQVLVLAGKRWKTPSEKQERHISSSSAAVFEVLMDDIWGLEMF